MVLLEALAARKPVIATAVGAVPKVLENNVSGLLIERKDVIGLRDAILQLIRDPDRTNQLAINGYKRVKIRFSSESMAHKYYSLYQSLTS